MIPLAYSISAKLAEVIKQIEFLRRKILLTPIAPKNELRLRWEAGVAQTYWSLTLSANPLTKNQMAKVLSRGLSLNSVTKHELEILNYKNALNYIATEWLVTGKAVSIGTLNTLFEIACFKIFPKSVNQTAKHKAELNTLFDYLNSSSDHPVVKAAIAQIELIQIAPFKEGNGRIARLIAYLFLYREGYDFAGLLVFDEYLRRDIVTLKTVLERATKSKNLTIWIEYFAEGVRVQLQKALELIESNRFTTDLPSSFWKVTQRQKQILFMLDEPGSKVTNKQVQKEFKISQITASRDLAKLTNLDLILSRAKGRATYYTKA